MRAAVYRGPGDIRIESVPEPRDPTGADVVIEVSRAAICGTDSAEWAHGPLLAKPPVVLGHEFGGVVVAAGADVARLVGTRVVCGAGISCGQCEWCLAGRTNLCAEYRTLGLHIPGGLAKYVTAPASICRTIPDGLSDDAAAIAQPLAVALHAVRRSGLRSGQSCAVLGVGGIGAFILAGAKAFGGAPVIAIDVDERRLSTARSLGADVTVDASDDSAETTIREATGGHGVDVAIEASGTAQGLSDCLATVKRGGRVLLVGLHSAPRELDLLALTVREVEISTTLAHVCDVDLPAALDLLASTGLAPQVTERVIDLADLVDEGIRPLANGTARGKIVVAP